jgi:hypothetical protein
MTFADVTTENISSLPKMVETTDDKEEPKGWQGFRSWALLGCVVAAFLSVLAPPASARSANQEKRGYQSASKVKLMLHSALQETQ